MSSPPGSSPLPQSFPSAPVAPFRCVAGPDHAGLLLICDHASANIPACYNDLGLAAATRWTHVVWDIGAAALTERLAALLGCPAILAGASRLVVDCNRALDDPMSMPACSCGVDVPGNRDLTEAEIVDRLRTWFWPYHDAVAARLSRMAASGRMPAVVSIHTFTPSLLGAERPWHVGVLWNRDGRMAGPALRVLREMSGLVVGDNQPYSARDFNYSLARHAEGAGLAHVSFEVRQDQVMDAAGVERWARLLALAVTAA